MSLTDRFLDEMKARVPLLHKSVLKTMNNSPKQFQVLSERMLAWYVKAYGDDFENLINGYKFFVLEVNRSQTLYEKEKKYRYSTYEEVKRETYSNDAFMSLYHWGVYVTTFAWHHHLEIHNFFESQFVNRIRSHETDKKQRLIDFGCGSGIWSILTASALKNTTIESFDISPRSITLAQKLVEHNGLSKQVNIKLGNAITVETNEPVDAAICSFLLEHLENPSELLNNIHKNLKNRAYLFITAAITAAEIDHIYEFKNESEIILALERAGFRCLASVSCAPENHPKNNHFLPRSIAILAQKKINNIW